MEFENGTSLEQIVGKDVDVYILTGETNIPSMPLCQAYMRNGDLWVDCAPPLDRKYTAQVPADALISRQDSELQSGRFGVFIRKNTGLAQLIQRLWDDEERRRKTLR